MKYNPRIPHRWSANILVWLVFLVSLVFFVFQVNLYDDLDQITNTPPTKNQVHKVKKLIQDEISTVQEATKGRVTAFSSVEFCATGYAKRVYPNCNGKTFPERTAAIRSEWLKNGVTSVYIPVLDKSYRVIGKTDGNTDIDIWAGNDSQAALAISYKSTDIVLQYD
jgi:hypothetical protein